MKRFLACSIVFSIATACAQTPQAVAPDEPRAPTETPTASASNVASPPDDPASTPSDSLTPPAPASDGELDGNVQAIEAGSKCLRGKAVTTSASSKEFRRTGDTWSRDEFWGCGCAERPEFVLQYVPNTSPLQVRLCHDDAADTCEAACTQTLHWPLKDVLAAAGATDVRFVD